MKKQKIDTICVQGGYKPGNGEPRILPIYQSTTYKYDSSEHLGKLFDLEAPGHMYSRISNPTLAYVEDKIAELEGGVGAMLTSSGQSANLLAILNLCSSGDNFVCSYSIYGGTVNLFAVTLKRMGIECRLFENDAEDKEVEKLIDDKTRLIFGETIANPALTVFDIERFAAIAHKHNIPLIIDNTFATPINCRPFEYGADIVTHSTTKYMDGHACVVGGVIVDSGNFDWTKGDFPGLTEPDESYHGVAYVRDFGQAAFITKARVQLMRDIGATAQPMTTFLLNLGLETLALRIERHCFNALEIATRLSKDERISYVNYPGLPNDKGYHLAQKYIKKGAGGVISFGVKGGKDAAMKFMDSLELVSLVVHVCDVRTIALHPASTTHRQLTDEQLAAGKVLPDMIRMSVGIENIEDIWADIDQALSKAVK